MSTIEQLQQLRLHGMAHSYAAILQLPIQQQPAAHELLAQLAEAEAQYRTQRRTQLYLSLSKLRYDAVLSEIHTSAERNFTRDQLAALADCSFVFSSRNILLLDPPAAESHSSPVPWAGTPAPWATKPST